MVITPEKLVRILDMYQSGLIVQAMAEYDVATCDGRKVAKAREELRTIRLYMARFYAYIMEASRQGVKVDHDDVVRYLRNK